MTLENTSLKQHGRMVALAGVLLATACGGTFSGTGSAGAAGSGTGGEGAGWSSGGVGTGGGFVCNSECPLIACNGVSIIQPGECCPTCEPSGGAGGISSGGAPSGGAGAASGGACNGFACPAIACPAGWTTVFEPGACCGTCVPEESAGAGGGVGCGEAGCPAIDCAKGYMLQQKADECCPSCVPNDACTQGQQSYDMLRQQLISQPGAVACKVNNDCSLLSGNAYCGDECSQIPVNAAAAQSIDSELSTYATKNCSTCTPVYPPCAAPLPPACVDGQCVVAVMVSAG